MAVVGAVLPEGTRVRIRRGGYPVDPSLVGQTGTVVDSSVYHPHSYAVMLDGERRQRVFAPAELEQAEERVLEPDREEAKRRRALP